MRVTSFSAAAVNVEDNFLIIIDVVLLEVNLDF